MDDARTKPRWRGHSHQAAFFASLGAGPLLVAAAPTARTTTASLVYVASLLGLFGVSALYHRPMWPSRAREVMKRLDHSMIFVFIAGSYTPFCLLGLPDDVGGFVLSSMWGGGIALALTKLAGVVMPRWLSSASYVALGWFAAWSIPDALPIVGPTAIALLVSGGALYTLGALIYWRKTPDPLPGVFGYHEVFHLLVVCAGALHFVAVTGIVLRG